MDALESVADVVANLSAAVWGESLPSMSGRCGSAFRRNFVPSNKIFLPGCIDDIFLFQKPVTWFLDFSCREWS
jgi:hypothetical protein